MRKSMNLVLAAGLAVSAFGTTAAASNAAAGCDNPDELEYIDLSKGEVFVDEVSYLGTPQVGLYTGPDYMIDVPLKKADVRFTLTWSDGVSDYDLTITDVAADTDIAEGVAEDFEQEIVEVQITDCLHIEAGMFNYLGAPVNTLTLTVEVI